MKQKRFLLAALAVLAVVLVAVPASAGRGGWTTVDLGVGSPSYAYAINNDGVIVGDRLTASTSPRESP